MHREKGVSHIHHSRQAVVLPKNTFSEHMARGRQQHASGRLHLVHAVATVSASYIGKEDAFEQRHYERFRSTFAGVASMLPSRSHSASSATRRQGASRYTRQVVLGALVIERQLWRRGLRKLGVARLFIDIRTSPCCADELSN